MKYKKFFELGIWKIGFMIQKEIFDLVASFPLEEKYALASQINRATNSVIANIAESHGRFSFKDKIRVLYIVRGEIQEVQSHLIVAKSRSYISQERCVTYLQQYEKLKMRINRYITVLARSGSPRA